MDFQTNRGRVQIVSPAGNFEKLKFAVHYGADAVYFGGKEFNLRDQSGNLSSDEITDAVDFCRERNVRTVFLLNSFLHESDVDDARAFVKSIEKIPFDAVMVSDPGMLEIVKNSGMECDVHLSTQMSTLNHLSARFWERMGVKRIVLARETTVDEIKKIRDSVDVELEMFVHGALCISYSGRCLLSRFLSGRDANRGACTHPCRWKYSLMEEKRKGHLLEFIEHAKGTEILSSKDLCLLKKIPALIEAGVSAFKIEGRMKSLYYAANVTRIYKDAVNHYYQKKDVSERLAFWEDELDLVSHRPYTDDLFNEFDDLGFRELPYIKKALFMGFTIDEESCAKGSVVKAFNPIRVGDRIEAVYPIEGTVRDKAVIVQEIYESERPTDMARPSQICRIVFSEGIAPNIILRKRISDI